MTGASDSGWVRYGMSARVPSSPSSRGGKQGPYASLAELVERIDLRLCNKRVLESLVAAGACDSLGGHRKQLIEALEPALAEAQLLHQEREAGQGSLFGEAEKSGTTGKTGRRTRKPFPPPALPDLPPWTEAERLAKEKEVLGFFISGHPLERYREEVELFGTRTTATLSEWGEHQVSVAAVVTSVKRQISKKTGKEYARLVLEDFHGTAEAIVFPDAWAKLNADHPAGLGSASDWRLQRSGSGRRPGTVHRGGGTARWESSRRRERSP